MRIIAIILNAAILCLVAILIIQDGFPEPGKEPFTSLLVILFVIVPCVSIMALLYGKDNWISLYFKRKALEERKKIENLNKDEESK